MTFEPQIRPYKPSEWEEMHALASADQHAVVMPTHTVRKGGQIIGYLSLGALPTAFVWMDTKRAGPRDSYAVITFFENLLAPAGGVLVPVLKTSPYYKFMEAAGYVSMGDGTMFMKGLT